MNRIQLPIHEIQEVDRQRTEMGDIDGLAKSISRYGLIQPIVVNQHKVLIAGGRRLAACRKLNLVHVDVVFRETLNEEDLFELELEENVRRKDMRWQEHCLAIANVHKRRARAAGLEGSTWSQQMTAELLGVSTGNVNYCLEIARHLADASSPMWKCESFREAWRLRLRLEEDAVLAEIAKREQQQTATKEQIKADAEVIKEYEKMETADEVEYRHAKEKYESNPLNKEPFDEYWKERKAMLAKRAEAARSSVYLSNMIFNGDCIPYMCEADHRGMFDAIVTDIPYGIEMDTLNQDNFAHANIDTVEEEHDVEDNMQLMREFFPAAFACTKDSAFVVTWCDVMQWQFMYDLARKAGFEVQRWPITWIKTHACGNSMSQYNMTKNTEIAMVCRKPKTTLAKHTNQSTVTASNAEVKRALRHPFAKPYEVWHFILDAVTIEGQLILEPFAGSGSGVIAALQKKRRVIALEKQLGHYNNLLENVKTQHFLKLDPNYVFK